MLKGVKKVWYTGENIGKFDVVNINGKDVNIEHLYHLMEQLDLDAEGTYEITVEQVVPEQIGNVIEETK